MYNRMRVEPETGAEKVVCNSKKYLSVCKTSKINFRHDERRKSAEVDALRMRRD